jgi:hypothetical protein
MIDGPRKLPCQEMLNNFGSIDERNVSSIKAIKQSLEESGQTEEHAAFVKRIWVQSSKGNDVLLQNK